MGLVFANKHANTCVRHLATWQQQRVTHDPFMSLYGRTDSGTDTQGLSVRSAIHLCRNSTQRFTHEFVGNVASCFDNFQSSKDIASCIGKGLSVLECDPVGQVLRVLPNQRLIPEHDALSLLDRDLLPTGKRLRSRIDGLLDFGWVRFGNSCNGFVGSGILDTQRRFGIRRNKSSIDPILVRSNVHIVQPFG